MRRALILMVLMALAGCSRIGSMAQTVAGATAQAAQLGSGGENPGADEEGTLEVAMTLVTTIVNDIFRTRQRLGAALAATLIQLDLEAVLMEQGEAAALALLCSAPAPADIPPNGVSFRLGQEPLEPPGDLVIEPTGSIEPAEPVEPGAEPAEPVEPAEAEALDEPAPDAGEEEEEILFVATGELTDELHPVTLEISAEADDLLRVRVRGGGWLLCALFEADLDVDGAQWDLPLHPELTPTLDVSAWTPEEVGLDPEETAEVLGAVEVVFTSPLPTDAVIELLTADQLLFWVGDIPIELYPLESAETQRFVSYLLGEEAAGGSR